MSAKSFSKDFGKYEKGYLKIRAEDEFCRQADDLATKLVEQNNTDFAGIIMSSLCKLTEFIPAQLEKFALRGYEIAKANGDHVHMMARLNNLRKVYMNRPEKLYDYIQVLYKQEKCLKQLTRQYEVSAKSYNSVFRKVASKRDYEMMLAYVQTEIGKLTKKKFPQDARAKLLSAREIFAQRGNKQSVNYINMLLKEIKIQLGE